MILYVYESVHALFRLVCILIRTKCVFMCARVLWKVRPPALSDIFLTEAQKTIISTAVAAMELPAQIPLHGNLLQGAWVIDRLQLHHL